MKTERNKVIQQIIVFISVLGMSCCAWGASWTVGPSPTGDFATIQAAINAAAAGDTINVTAGIYSEQIIMNKAGLTLEGETNKYPAIRGPCGTTGGSGVINIQANNITIKGLEVYDSDGVYSYDTAAIWANWGGAKHNLTVNDCIIHNAHRGIAFSGSNVTIMGCNIYSNQDNGIYCSSDDSSTPYPFLVISNWIHSDALNYPGGGSPKGYSCISIRYANRYGRVAYNYLSSYRYGIRQDYDIGSAPGCGQILIEHNTFDGPAPSFMPDYTGIYTQRYGIFGNGYALPSNTVIRDNIFANLLGPGMYYLKNGGNASIICSNNLFYNCNQTYHYSDTYWYPSEGDATNAVANWHAVDANSFQFPGSYPNSDPMFVYTGTTAASYWALAAGSPALNAASDGRNIGAYQGPPVVRQAAVTLYNLSQIYDGTARVVTSTTDPAGLTVEITYDGSTSSPTNAGSYAVTGTVTTIPYQGSATGTLEVAKADQSITNFPNPRDQITTNTVGLWAQASSGLPVTNFAVISGPAVISELSNVTFTGPGQVSIIANQAGNANWNTAPAVTNTFNVTETVLSAPTSVSASDGTYTNKILVAWNAVSGATSYQVWRNTTDDLSSASLLATTTVTSYEDTTPAAPGVSIYYWVTARNQLSSGAFSQPDSGYYGVSSTVDLSLRGFLFQPIVLTTDSHPKLIMLMPVNNGPGNLFNSGIKFDFFLSRNTVFGDNDDELIGSYETTVNINAGSFTTVIISSAGLNGITIPGDASGTYYVFAKVSYTSVISDPDMSNNTIMYSAVVVGDKKAGVKLPVTGDFDGDGKADPCVYQESTGNWYVKLSGGRYESMEIRGYGGEGWKPVSGDFDGDGLSDPALYQESTGNWRILLSGSDYLEFSATVGGLGYTPVSGDFNGGRKSDLAVYREATGYWLGIYMETESPGFAKFVWQDGYVPVTGDYTGDGVTDLALYQESTGSWFLKQGNMVYTITEFGGVGWKPVGGDYDGDGKEDLMLYQASTGNWMVRLSGSDYTIANTEGFGGPDYVPVSGDYDGDGLADLVLYNAVTSTWLFQLSAANYIQSSTTF